MGETAVSAVTPQHATGVHLVGSVCLADAESVFVTCCKLLPARLCRIPDGEPGHRQNFVEHQRQLFAQSPRMLRQYDTDFNPLPEEPIFAEDVQRLVESLPPLRTGYDDYALESYALFCRLRAEGNIPNGIRFQVSLPTPANVMCLVADSFQAALEPLYEDALLRDARRIQREIPKEDLAIQWDVAAEIAQLEGALWPHFKPFFEPVKEGILERLARYGNAIETGVELGYHLCYGDIGHRHFKEPKDLGLLVEIANSVMQRVARPVDWFQMPVPKNRDDTAYFDPLTNLRLGRTELYLGLVHAGDEEGTKNRINAASQKVTRFGISTECGMGRTPPDEFESIMHISASLSLPISERPSL
ncbi:hypothetical protein K490DRAFT_61529 [Saccharata proteae CBS 121410]|uniref:Uncharacterized protein n=1 Tax=Saccharata proteae CBS 121410 TaxID=1314787 RepID=A0A9P4I3K0_9PEZI|nr:hypothetical protein K490DRAFT_61529 [Saccharata proteae CBS 121410]